MLTSSELAPIPLKAASAAHGDGSVRRDCHSTMSSVIRLIVDRSTRPVSGRLAVVRASVGEFPSRPSRTLGELSGRRGVATTLGR